MSVNFIIETSEKRLRLMAKPKIVFGRRKDNVDIVLDDPKVSSTHFEITYDKESVIVRDLGSKNGTYLNQIKLDKEQKFFIHDIISIGSIKIYIDSKSLNENEISLFSKRGAENYWGEDLTNITEDVDFSMVNIKKKAK